MLIVYSHDWTFKSSRQGGSGFAQATLFVVSLNLPSVYANLETVVLPLENPDKVVSYPCRTGLSILAIQSAMRHSHTQNPTSLVMIVLVPS